MRAALPALALLALSAPAVAGDRGLTTLWTIAEAPAGGPEPVDLRRGDFVFKQRLLPMGLVEIGATPAGRVEGLVEGKQLVQIQTADALVFCDPVIRQQKLIGHAQPCLVDADRDGRFEGLFLTSSVTKGILTVEGNRPKAPRAIEPLPYRKVDPATFSQALFVGLEYRGSANPMGNHVFQLDYGSDEQTGSLTNRIVHQKADIPGSKDIMGGRFTILAATPDGIRVRVDRPFPSQPFGVVKTTTYRFY